VLHGAPCDVLAVRVRMNCPHDEPTAAMTSVHKISIEVETTYLDDQSEPREQRYVFAYTITIRNEGDVPAKLLTRHWIITDANGRVQEVRGDGVVGEQPYLKPGQGFRYSSGAVLETPVGTMQGSYQMVADDGAHLRCAHSGVPPGHARDAALSAGRAMTRAGPSATCRAAAMSSNALLARIRFQRSRSAVVRRRPGQPRTRSLQALRLVRALGDNAVRARQSRPAPAGRGTGRREAAQAATPSSDILAAPRRDALLEWLLQLPLAHFETGDDGDLLLHAGVLPQWSVAQTLELAREVQRALRTDAPGAALGHVRRSARSLAAEHCRRRAPALDDQCAHAAAILHRRRPHRSEAEGQAGLGARPWMPWFKAPPCQPRCAHRVRPLVGARIAARMACWRWTPAASGAARSPR
jgi:ApaG protein